VSRIDELIAELAPKGVEFKPVGEVTAKNSNIKWVNAGDDEFQYIDLSSVDRVTRRIGETASITAGNAPSRAQQIVHTGDVIFATTRPAQMRWAVIPAEYDGQIASTGYCVLRPDTSVVLTNFLAHILGADAFRQYVEANQVAGNYPSIPDNRVRAYRIPVPPLEVQREIVRILDQFTQLEAELDAELEARRRQYEHYRATLLFGNEDDEHAPLYRFAAYSDTRIDASALDSSSFVGVDNLLSDKRGKTEANYLPNTSRLTAYQPGDILIGNIRPYLKKIWLADSSGGCSGDVLAVRITDAAQGQLEPAYLYYLLSSDSFFSYNMQHAKGAKMPRGDKAAILNYPIHVPSLGDQRRIVEVLQKFDALVNDISIGLPAELAARRKQYEYYRDKLLTFKEAA
jgi:type I restriction enzyme S subunit